jgi:two-component system, OmpR family, sensor histidine kinase RstB
MSRLYLRFYVALLGSLVVFAIATALIWHRVGGPAERAGDALGILVQNVLPAADAPAADQQLALQKLVAGIDAGVVLLGADRSMLASVGQPLLSTRVQYMEQATSTIQLPDGRSLVASVAIGIGHPAYALLLILSVLAVAVGVGAYPIVRRLTKRLERLQRGVESLGAGDMSARVAVEGKDEVARLALSFNRAAGRIETLVGAHKALLANASHELRTPLARIRMTVELMKESADPKRKAGLDQDIAELDRLIDEILLASRLDALTGLEVDEEVDLLALAAEECSRYAHAQLDGVAVCVDGDSHLLRRMLRNLLENAERHGVAPTHVHIAQNQGDVEISVSDNGLGIPVDERERVFEPFYRRTRAGDNAGAGLGLALVRQIARRHGGEAQCVRTGDERSCFSVRIPIRRPRFMQKK